MNAQVIKIHCALKSRIVRPSNPNWNIFNFHRACEWKQICSQKSWPARIKGFAGVNSVFVLITASLTTSFQLQIKCNSWCSTVSVEINYHAFLQSGVKFINPGSKVWFSNPWFEVCNEDEHSHKSRIVCLIYW